MIKPRRAVMEMQSYNPPTSNRGGMMRLDFNENTDGCSDNAIKLLRKIKKSALSAYPEYNELRKEMAKYCNVKEEEIIAANGADEAIKTIIETYIERVKDEIVIPVPTYAMFKFYAQLNEASIKEVAYNRDLSFPTERVLGAINTKTKIIVLVNPNNPTGTSIDAKDKIKIIEKAKRFNSLVLMDEAYAQFYGKTSIPLIKKYDNLFIVQTLSKAFGLAGLRLGYIISDESNIKIIQKVLSPYSVNVVAAICASIALEDSRFIKEYLKEVRAGKQILYKELDYLGIKYYKSDANFVLAKIGANADEFCKKLREKGILVRNRSGERLLAGCVRVTIGTTVQTKRLIKEMRRIVREINPLLIFDIDGVLVDVSKSYREAIKETAEYFTGRVISAEEIQEYKNRGGLNNDWDLTEAIIKGNGKSVDKRKIIKKFQEYYGGLIYNEKWLLDKRILKSLSKRHNLAVLTGRPKKEADYVLKRNKTADCFGKIIAMEDVLRQKPNPEGLLKILSRFQNSDAYYFGDSIDDMKTAVSANVKAIGVLPPQDRSKQLQNLLIKYGAKTVIRDINMVMEVLQ